MYVYILDLEDGKFYVGSTAKKLEHRLREHLEGKGLGADFTKAHKPLAHTIKSKHFHYFLCDSNKAEKEELTKTLELMYEKGIDNVRGGPYCEMNLSDATKNAIQPLIDHLNRLCFNCHKPGHLRKNCSSQNSQSVPNPPADDCVVEMPKIEDEIPRSRDRGSGGWCNIL